MEKKTSTRWEIKLSPLALKDLRTLDKGAHKIILGYLYKKLETADNPRRFGKPLSGNLRNFWRYRVNHSKAYKNIHFLRSST